jgi:hypothetical protein
MVRAALVPLPRLPRPHRRRGPPAAHHHPGAADQEHRRHHRPHPRHRGPAERPHRADRAGRGRRRRLTRRHGRHRPRPRRRGVLRERTAARVRARARQGRRHVAQPVRGPRRPGDVRRLRLHRLRRALRLRHPRAAADRPSGPVQQGRVPPPVQPGRQGRGGRGRPGHRADGQAAAELLLPGADRVRAAAGRGVRGPPRAAVQHPVRHRLRDRDRDDGRRPRRGGPVRHGPGRPGNAAEPAPAAVRPDPDELGGAARAGPPGPSGRTRRRRPRPVRNAGPAPAGRLPARGRHPRRAAAGRAPGRAAGAAAPDPRAVRRPGTGHGGLIS